MHIGFVGLADPHNFQSYSGTSYCMTRALMRQGCEVSFLLQNKEQGATLDRLQGNLARFLTGRHTIRKRDPIITGHFPEQANGASSQHPIDAALGISPFHLAATNSSLCSVLWADTILARSLDSCRDYKHLTKRSLTDRRSQEQAALNRSTLAVFSNQWVADVACASYSFDQRKVRVIPYGANLLIRPSEDDIAECLHRRDAREYELLFVGTDWKWNGAQIAVDTTSVLRTKGLNVHLTLVGCVPPPAVSLPEYVTVVGGIDKSTQRGHALLASLYMQSHLLILSGYSEHCDATISEANAYGVPCLCTSVGANSTLIKNDMNGQLFPIEAGSTDYAEYAQQLLGDPQRYTAMCWSSFERFQTDLNWDVAVSRLIAEMNKVLRTASEAYACIRAS